MAVNQRLTDSYLSPSITLRVVITQSKLMKTQSNLTSQSTHLCYTWNYLTLGICSFLSSLPWKYWCHFPPKSTQSYYIIWHHNTPSPHAKKHINHRAESRFVDSQWGMTLLCNDVSHWLGANLESSLHQWHKTNHCEKYFAKVIWKILVNWFRDQWLYLLQSMN